VIGWRVVSRLWSDENRPPGLTVSAYLAGTPEGSTSDRLLGPGRNE
jgi:hypothetical protein